MRVAISICTALAVAFFGSLLCAHFASAAAGEAAVTVHLYMTGLDAPSSKQAIAGDAALAEIMDQRWELSESAVLLTAGAIGLLCFGAGALASSGRGKRADGAKRQAPRPDRCQAPGREVVYVKEPAPPERKPSAEIWGQLTPRV